MKIKVTEQDIVEGISGDGELCPVAIALTRTVNRTVCVENDRITIYERIGCGIQQLLQTPTTVKSFINRFDYKRPVEPFEFELDVDIA